MNKAKLPDILGKISDTDGHINVVTKMVRDTPKTTIRIFDIGNNITIYPLVVAFIEYIIVTKHDVYHNIKKRDHSPSFWYVMDNKYGECSKIT